MFTKPNHGKWSAHNYGLRRASGHLILCIDADSRMETGALRLMVRHMRDKTVGAVSGQIRVRNRKSLAGLFQAFEYVLANGALRLCTRRNRNRDDCSRSHRALPARGS